MTPDGARRWWRRRRAPALPGSVRRALPGQVPPTRREPAAIRARRRRVVTTAGAGGAGLLGISFSTRPGSPQFYLLTLGVAGTWTAGAVRAGPLHRGWTQGRDGAVRRPVVMPVLTGAGAFGLFCGPALVARRIPPLEQAIGSVLRFADNGPAPLVVLPTCANGVAEELFLRGALHSAVGEPHPVAKTTIAYTAAITATRNPALALAGAAMGVIFGLQRRATGGVQAPVLTHLTWSLLMLRYLPPLFRNAIRAEQPAADRVGSSMR